MAQVRVAAQGRKVRAAQVRVWCEGVAGGGAGCHERTIVTWNVQLVGGWIERVLVATRPEMLSAIPPLMVHAAGRCDTCVPPKARKAVASLI